MPQLQWHRQNIIYPILEDEIEKNLSYLIMQKHKGLSIEVHPILYAYLTKGFLFSKLAKWRRKYKQRIKLKSSTNYQLTGVSFLRRKR